MTAPTVPTTPTRRLVPLPGQPAGVAWPTTDWETARPEAVGGDADALAALLDELVDDDEHPTLGRSYGAAVVVGGRLVAERYGRRVVQDLRSLEPDPPFEPVDPHTGLLSWSMAKSVTSLAVGVAVGDGALRLEDPVPEPRWSALGDRRADITWDDLLTMRPGLAWSEDYDLDSGTPSDVIAMLFGDGASDMAAYAASKALVAEPGSPQAFTYSSGTTNIVTANLQRVLGLDGPAMDAFVHQRVLDPIGMAAARAEFDPAGTFVGSSYLWAPLRDWCRLGLLALRDGVWDGRRIVPAGWIDHARTARSPRDDIFHGAHWWTWDQDQMPFGAHGYEGQRVICFPTRDLVVVRLGKSATEQAGAINEHLTRIAGCFPER